MKTTPIPITQQCIKKHFFSEVMLLPKEVKIISINFEVGLSMKRMSVPVSSALTELGVTAIRNADPSVEVDGRVVGSRKQMKEALNTITSSLGLNVNTVRVRRMTVEVGKNIGVFYRMNKKLPDGDKVKRMTVLGLVKWTGDETAIANACHTNVYKCTYTTQMIRTVLCEES